MCSEPQNRAHAPERTVERAHVSFATRWSRTAPRHTGCDSVLSFFHRLGHALLSHTHALGHAHCFHEAELFELHGPLFECHCFSADRKEELERLEACISAPPCRPYLLIRPTLQRCVCVCVCVSMCVCVCVCQPSTHSSMSLCAEQQESCSSFNIRRRNIVCVRDQCLCV